jgi:hypothetical protein
MRREVQANDLSVRRQQEQTGSTFHQHALADADIPRGRFSAVTTTTVVGATAVPQYPAAGPHQADPCGQEPPLGYRVDAQEPLEPTASAQGNSGDAVATPSSGPLADDVEGTVSPSFSTAEAHLPASGVGSPVPYRRR